MAQRMSNFCVKFTFAKVEKHLKNHLQSVIVKRFYSSNKTIRVRFAPSPTGLLHLGGLRTALYNHLFAKSQNGVTILRIEDTDQARKVDLATQALIEDLAWCGIKFDEGPYFQSERIEIYKKYADQLLQEGKAYYCFCSKMRLELLRKEAKKAGEISKYDNCCRSLTEEEINKKLMEGEVPCVRFKLCGLTGLINDLIHDPITYEAFNNEGDPVIIKADGFPTYHFANVVDDHLMNISHVLRGVEWQVSTSKHILLYRAFNWEPPLYGHIPLLMNSDGTKLSKRQGDLHIQGLRNDGYFPNAILNFVVRFGGGFTIEQKEKDVHIFTLEELLDRFDLTKIKSNSSKIALSKLNDYNNLEIKRLLATDDGANKLVKQTQQIISKHFQQSKMSKKLNIESEYIKLILIRMKERIAKLEDLVSSNFIYLWYWDNSFIIEKNESITFLEKFSLQLDGVDWELQSLKRFIKEFGKENKLNFAKFMKLLRMILIENEEGPSIAELLEILGKETVQYRIMNVIEKSKKNNSKESEESAN